MDPNSGRIVADMRDLTELEQEKFKPVPTHLREHAERELKGRRETTVPLTGDSPLAKWAAKQRQKNRTRNKIAKRARVRGRK